ncbi:hypothetical protein D3C73_1088690 [compost metagenome]
MLQCISAVECGDALFHKTDQGVCNFPVHQQIVRRNAGLPGVDQLAPDNPLRGGLQISAFVDNDRAFAAQLQGDGNQLLRCGFHHDLADRHAAGEKNIIKLRVNQQTGHFLLALYHPDIAGLECILNHLLDDGRDGRRAL